MIRRKIVGKILESKKSIMLLGPRQAGKSTLLKSLQPDLAINLSMESVFFQYSTKIDLLETTIQEQKPKTVFIDEIQRIPSLLNTIQAIIDDMKNPPKFYLSGSSARKLKRGQANLIPGRIFTYQMSGLCAAELQYEMDYKKAMAFGCLPEPYFEKDKNICSKILQDYSATYLKEEIQAESLSRNIQNFARFLSAIAEYSGSICDFSKISTKSKVSRSSCIRFVEILEDTLVANRVEVFQDAGDADVIKHPKIYFFDVGVLNGLLDNFEVSSDRIGNLFEHFIYSQIRNSALAADRKIEIQYFRTRSDFEVDFIIKIKNQVWAIEVKSGEVQNADLSSLRAFRGYYPKVHKCIVVSPKEQRRMKDNILICNWVEMLKEMDL